MDMIYFLTRYTPFWSIPIFMISAEFTYLFWMRKKKKSVMICLMLAAVTMLSTIGYFIMGGPEKSVEAMIKVHWYFTR